MKGTLMQQTEIVRFFDAYNVGFSKDAETAATFYSEPCIAARAGSARVGFDLAPKFYPILSSPWRLDLPGWAVGATGAGAELSA